MVEFQEYYEVPAGARDALNELQMLDHISGQCDRHMENYFASATSVFGIDLDMAWGQVGDANNPYSRGGCKLATEPPRLTQAALTRFEKLAQNNLLQTIIDKVGADMGVDRTVLTQVKTAAVARLTTVLRDAKKKMTGVYIPKMQNSYFAREKYWADESAKCNWSPATQPAHRQPLANAQQSLPVLQPPRVPAGGPQIQQGWKAGQKR